MCDKLATKLTRVFGVKGKHININIGTNPCLSIKCINLSTDFRVLIRCKKLAFTNFRQKKNTVNVPATIPNQLMIVPTKKPYA